MVAYVNKKMKNKILLIHAAWLFENGYYEEYKDCLKQAKEYSQDKDLRQTNGYFKRLKKTQCERTIIYLGAMTSFGDVKKLKRTGGQIMPRAIPCTSSDDPAKGSLGAFGAPLVRARKAGV